MVRSNTECLAIVEAIDKLIAPTANIIPTLDVKFRSGKWWVYSGGIWNGFRASEHIRGTLLSALQAACKAKREATK